MENKKKFSVIALTVIFSIIGIFLINFIGKARITGAVIKLTPEMDFYSTIPALIIIAFAIIGLVYMVVYLRE